MARTLLEDRFKLKFHRESRDVTVAVLVASKSGPRNLNSILSAGATSHEMVDGRLVLKNVSMPRFAVFLGNSPPNGVNEKVLDQTELQGSFDISLDVKNFDVTDAAFGGNYEDMRSAFFVFFSTMLERKYGLKLEHKKVSLESLVIDAGTKVPIDN